MEKFAKAAIAAYSWAVRMSDSALTFVLRRFLSWISYAAWLMGEELGKYRLRRWYGDRFEKKHSQEDLFLLAMFWPHGCPMTIRSVQSKIPFINKNDAATVANMAKDKVKYLKILQWKTT